MHKTALAVGKRAGARKERRFPAPLLLVEEFGNAVNHTSAGVDLLEELVIDIEGVANLACLLAHNLNSAEGFVRDGDCCESLLASGSVEGGFYRGVGAVVADGDGVGGFGGRSADFCE